jgi:hypothetical protein
LGTADLNAQGAATPGYTEPEIKAAFVMHLTGFMTWPESRRPKVVCATQVGATFNALENLLRARQGTTIELRVIGPGKDSDNCDLLFYGTDDEIPSYSSLRKGQLTVGDLSNFALDGGMVELRRSANRMRLIINRRALAYGGFTASSRLLSLATLVDPEEAP